MRGTTLTVIDSDHGAIPEGTTLTVEGVHKNQFTDRFTITVSAEGDGRTGNFQLYRMPDTPKDVYHEIVVGRESDTVCVSSQ